MYKDCIVCMQPITNPLCVDCYTKQLEVWLKSIDYSPNATRKLLREIRQKFDLDETTGEKCIKCGKELTVCSYCFFFGVSLILRRITQDEEFIQYYSATFNYVTD